MPAFLAALIMATVIRILSPVPVLDTPTVPQFLANLTMAPSLFGQEPMDMPYWTLTYELVFYIGMGLILALGMLRWTEWFGLLAVAVGCLLIATMDVRLHHRTSILLLVYYSNFFLIGICLYRIHAHMARPVTWVALVVAIAVTVLGGGERSFDTPGRLYLPLTIAFTALVWFAISRHGKWLAWRPLVFLGVISYPLYLVHVVLGFAVIRWGVAHGWSTIEGVVAAGVVSIVTGDPAALFRRSASRTVGAERPERMAAAANPCQATGIVEELGLSWRRPWQGRCGRALRVPRAICPFIFPIRAGFLLPALAKAHRPGKWAQGHTAGAPPPVTTRFKLLSELQARQRCSCNTSGLRCCGAGARRYDA
jgi:peptidoglycan/LPS O-acetylase OafA/YrhL